MVLLGIIFINWITMVEGHYDEHVYRDYLKVLVKQGGVTIVIFACLLFSVVYIGFMPNYQVGEADGVIVSESEGGLCFNTFQYKLQMGVDRNTETFTTNDPKVVEKLLYLRGKRVTLYYREWLVQPWWVGFGHEVYDVKLRE